jgi:hypothetical protein
MMILSSIQFDLELLQTLRKIYRLLDDAKYECLREEVVDAFLRGLSRALVEALLDAMREAHHNKIRWVADDLGWSDVGSYYKARKAGSLASKLIALILVKHGDRVRFDPVYAEKLGYVEAVRCCARKLGKGAGELTMAEIDTLQRILASPNAVAQAEKEPGAQPWIGPFLLAMMILTEEVGNGPGV